MREYVQKQFWLSFVDEGFDLDNAIQTEAEFSCAIAGWEDEESWEGSKLAARMGLSFATVNLTLQGYRMQKFRSIMEPVNWV